MKKAFDTLTKHIKKDQITNDEKEKSREHVSDLDDRLITKNEDLSIKNHEIKSPNPNSGTLPLFRKDANKSIKHVSLNKQIKAKAIKLLKPNAKKDATLERPKTNDHVSEGSIIESVNDNQLDTLSISSFKIFPNVGDYKRHDEHYDTVSVNSTEEVSLLHIRNCVKKNTDDILHLYEIIHDLDKRFTSFTSAVQQEVEKIHENFYKFNDILDKFQFQINDRLSEIDDQITVYMNKTSKLDDQLAQQQNTINCVDSYFGDLERKWGSPVLRSVIPVMVLLLVTLSTIWQKIGHKQFLIPAAIIVGLWFLKKYLFG